MSIENSGCASSSHFKIVKIKIFYQHIVVDTSKLASLISQEQVGYKDTGPFPFVGPLGISNIQFSHLHNNAVHINLPILRSTTPLAFNHNQQPHPHASLSPIPTSNSQRSTNQPLQPHLLNLPMRLLPIPTIRLRKLMEQLRRDIIHIHASREILLQTYFHCWCPLVRLRSCQSIN